jgi:hypothetical protein
MTGEPIAAAPIAGAAPLDESLRPPFATAKRTARTLPETRTSRATRP